MEEVCFKATFIVLRTLFLQLVNNKMLVRIMSYSIDFVHRMGT